MEVHSIECKAEIWHHFCFVILNHILSGKLDDVPFCNDSMKVHHSGDKEWCKYERGAEMPKLRFQYACEYKALLTMPLEMLMRAFGVLYYIQQAVCVVFPDWDRVLDTTTCSTLLRRDDFLPTLLSTSSSHSNSWIVDEAAWENEPLMDNAGPWVTRGN